MSDKTGLGNQNGSKDSKPAPDTGERNAINIAWASGPFFGLKKGEEVTLRIRGLPDQAIPVFSDEAAVKWAVARQSETRAFPNEQKGVVFYVGPGTLGIITKLKKFEIDSKSWTEAAKIRLVDGSKRAGWVSISMIFNPRFEKVIDEWKSRSGKK
jgi:hypothetical protein